MPQRTDTLDLARLGLHSGQARRFEFDVAASGFHYGGQRYDVEPALVPVVLDLSKTVSSGWAIRLRFTAALTGPCMRCLEPAAPAFDVDAREIDQLNSGDELSSPYVKDGELNLVSWAHESLALALPPQITCRRDCRGLCAQCGANLNDEPGHAHAREPDARWAKLSELTFDE